MKASLVMMGAGVVVLGSSVAVEVMIFRREPVVVDLALLVLAGAGLALTAYNLWVTFR